MLRLLIAECDCDCDWWTRPVLVGVGRNSGSLETAAARWRSGGPSGNGSGTGVCEPQVNERANPEKRLEAGSTDRFL
jgi:hypothetical protein